MAVSIEKIEAEEFQDDEDFTYITDEVYDFLSNVFDFYDYESYACDTDLLDVIDALKVRCTQDEDLNVDEYTEMLESFLLFMNRQRMWLITVFGLNYMSSRNTAGKRQSPLNSEQAKKMALFPFLEEGIFSTNNSAKVYNEHDWNQILEVYELAPFELKEKMAKYIETISLNSFQTEFTPASS